MSAGTWTGLKTGKFHFHSGGGMFLIFVTDYQGMRSADECPECEGNVGRVDRAIKDGEVVLKYWHTETEHQHEYCLEYADGGTEAVCKGGEPTGPRA